MQAQDYKGYKIVVKWGVGFEILKEYRGKFFELSRQNFNFTNADQPLNRACTYIDQYAPRLEEKFKAAFIAFCEEVYKNPNGYGSTKIDVVYYLNAYKKLKKI